MVKGFYFLARAFVGHYLKDFIEYRVFGESNLPKGSAIIVPNHEMGTDSVMLTVPIGRQIHYLADSNLGNLGPLKLNELSFGEIKRRVRAAQLKGLLWALGQVPVGVDRRSSNKQVVERVGHYLTKTNDYVGIFAEGPAKNLAKNGVIISLEERPHNGGAAHFAVKYQKPIVPVAIATLDEVAQELWEFPFGRREEKMVFVKKFVEERGKIPYVIQIGEPILRKDKEELTQEVKKRICSMYNEAKKSLRES